MHGDKAGIELAADQLVEGSRGGCGLFIVADEGDAAGGDFAGEASRSGSANGYAVAGVQGGVVLRFYHEGFAAVLNEELFLHGAEIGDGGLKGDRKRLGGFIAAEGANGAQ